MYLFVHNGHYYVPQTLITISVLCNIQRKFQTKLAGADEPPLYKFLFPRLICHCYQMEN
jgi:hypothetical protein